MKKITQEEFITKAKLKHGNKYDYSKVIYINSRRYIIITCPEHGDFTQVPSNHLQGQNCPKCGVTSSASKRALTQEEFITKANYIHKGKYDYSKAIYINSSIKIIILCPEHGEFIQTPNNHLSGAKCPKCVNRNTPYNLAEFIEKANYIHKGKYDYSKVQNLNSNLKITIGCQIHGNFQQRYLSHLNGQGCHKCHFSNLSKLKKMGFEVFEEKAKKVHNDKYKYDKNLYIDTKHHVTIICPDHGLFRQKGNSHLQGAGCPKCRSSKGETRIINILNKYKINYIKEYIIPGAKQRYRYDFYLSDYNILLEFHGGQHYFPVEYFGGVDAFKSLKERDLFKIELAKSARIPLIVFNYKQLKELSEQEFEKSVILKIRGTNV